MNRTLFFSALSLVLFGSLGCEPERPLAENVFAPLGEVVPFANEEQRATFERGEAVALRRFGPQDGLGPHFNVTSCGHCHEKPVFGGSAGHYRDFQLVAQRFPDGSAAELGVNGVLPQYELEDSGISPADLPRCVGPDGEPAEGRGYAPGSGPTDRLALRREIDEEANTFGLRNPIPFFGVGLIAQISEEAIRENIDANDEDGDGISGRANLDRGFIGRFGRKAQTVSVENFIRGPLFNHLGITSNPLSPERQAQLPVPSVAMAREDSLVQGERVQGVGQRTQLQAAAPSEPLTDTDDICDPELSDQDLFDLVSWAMLLAPPPQDPVTDQTAAGAIAFEAIGCADCHVQSLPSPRGRVPLYSDLLLHDMGPELADGLVMGLAGGAEHCGEDYGCEWRTQPLWGIAAAAPYLHDGRAGTLEEAILWHGGEGQASRDRYEALDAETKAALLAFLNALGGADQTSEGLLPQNAPIPPAGELGGPSFPMGEENLALFERGRAIFDRDVYQSEGLGPNFNGDSCRACHFDPIIGGAGPEDVDVIRHGFDRDGVFEEPSIGTMAHRHTFADDVRAPFDRAANVITARQTLSLFGVGLLERIPEEMILAGEDPLDANEDGIRGRAHRLPDGRLGRFGWNADVPSLAEFARDALSMEVGLTLPPQEGLSYGFATDEDDTPDPEISVEEIEALTFYMANLGPAPSAQMGESEAEGRALFFEIGCGECHANFETTIGSIEAYSDLLLHDVQEESFIGVPSFNSTGREFRTTPLWGVRHSAPYWHDGRAYTLEDAIANHASEAEGVRQRFEALSAEERGAVLRFLEAI